jgi:hypothetical protein
MTGNVQEKFVKTFTMSDRPENRREILVFCRLKNIHLSNNLGKADVKTAVGGVFQRLTRDLFKKLPGDSLGIASA